MVYIYTFFVRLQNAPSFKFSDSVAASLPKDRCSDQASCWKRIQRQVQKVSCSCSEITSKLDHFTITGNSFFYHKTMQLLQDHSDWSSHVHKTPLQMRACSLCLPYYLFCLPPFSCSLKERIYLVSIHRVSLLDSRRLTWITVLCLLI